MKGAANAATMPRLTYLGIRSVAEPIRLALHIGGIPFEDRRVTYEQIAAMRASGELPMGQVPMLEVEGKCFCQTQALLRWAGEKANLYPKGQLDRLQCDQVEEALADMRSCLKPLWCK